MAKVIRPAARVTRIYPGGDGLIRRAKPATSADWASVTTEMARIRYLAREALPPSRDDGINVGRIDRFLEGKGLQPPVSVLLTRAEVAAYRDELARHGWGNNHLDRLASPDERRWFGGYFTELGIVVMVRSEELERLNGPAYTEAFLVHEKAHGNAVDGQVIYEKSDGHLTYWKARGGFAVHRNHGRLAGSEPYEGHFLEEGFAEMLAGEYVAKELCMPDGVWRGGSRPYLGPELDKVPAKYLWKADAHGSVASQTAAIAATGMELLIRLRPELYPALIRARTSVNGQREAARLIDTVRPGIYSELRALDYTQAAFLSGLAAVRSSSLPLAAASVTAVNYPVANPRAGLSPLGDPSRRGLSAGSGPARARRSRGAGGPAAASGPARGR